MSDRDYLRHDFGGRGPRSPFWASFPGTKVLLIALVAIHLLYAIIDRLSPAAGQAIAHALWLTADGVLRRFFLWQLVTCALFHGPGLWHLGVNCLILYFFGRMVEERLPPKRFAWFCAGAVVTASFAYLVESVLLDQWAFPMIGASGLVMGLIVLAAAWYPHRPVLFMFIIPMPLWVLAVIAVVIDLLMVLDMAGGVAHSAHLGGALYGWIYFKYGGGFERIFGRIDAMADARRRRKDERRRARDAELRQEVDRILDKVNREGMAALSEEERRFLKDASARLRR